MYCLCGALVCDDAIMDMRNEEYTYSQPDIFALGSEMRRRNLSV